MKKKIDFLFFFIFIFFLFLGVFIQVLFSLVEFVHVGCFPFTCVVYFTLGISACFCTKQYVGFLSQNLKFLFYLLIS